MEITSVHNKLIKEMMQLHHKKHRDEKGLFLVEGYHLYEEASRSHNIHSVFTTDRSITGEHVTYVSESVLKKLAKIQSPQGIVTVCYKIKRQEVKDKVLLLDHVQDPGNLGTLLRSALAFGFETVVLDHTVDLYNEKVLRSTQGAMYQLHIIQMDALEFIEEHNNHTLYGTSMKGALLDSIDFPEKMILILGNEGQGVRKELLDCSKENITIKTSQVDSLNVGVAGSIIMHHVMNKTL